MEQVIYLCLQQECKGKTRFIEDVDDIISQTGEHHGHNCQKLEKIQVKLQPLVDFWGEENVNKTYIVSEQSGQKLKEDCKSLIDQFLDESKTKELIKAVMSKDIDFLQETQSLFKILNQPEEIIERHKQKYAFMEENLPKMFSQLTEQLHQIFKFFFLTNYTSFEEIQKKKAIISQSEDDLNQKIEVLQTESENLRSQFEKKYFQSQMQMDQLQEILNLQEMIKSLPNPSISNEINQSEIVSSSQFQEEKKEYSQSLVSMEESGVSIYGSRIMNQNVQYGQNHQINFRWSRVDKHKSITIQGNLASNQNTPPSAYQTVILEPQLNFLESNRVFFKIASLQSHFFRGDDEVFVQLCDLNIVKTKYPNLCGIHNSVSGVYSHRQNGKIHDSNGQGIISSFKYTVGDFIELQWDGPKREFTTVKISNGEKYLVFTKIRFKFPVDFSPDAKIFFAVSLFGQTIMEII